MSGPTSDDALIADLARATVERAAPAELPLFGPTSEAFFEDPAALERSGGGDKMLGFGVDAALVLITPAALSVAKDVFGFVAAQVRARLRDEGEGDPNEWANPYRQYDPSNPEDWANPYKNLPADKWGFAIDWPKKRPVQPLTDKEREARFQAEVDLLKKAEQEYRDSLNSPTCKPECREAAREKYEKAKVASARHWSNRI